MSRKRKRSTGAERTAERSRGPRLTAPRGAWRWLLLTAAFLATLALLYPEAMFGGRVFASADAANSDAFRVAGDRSLAEDGYPLWNPYLFCGMPSFGSLAYVRFLYPPSLVLETLQDHLGFPPLTWLLAHLLFGALGMAWLLARWRLPLALLLAGGVLWLLLPKIVAWGVHGHGSKLGAAMYLPWLVGWTLRVLDGGGARAVGMVGLLLGLQLLRGHVQITYYTLLLLGWLALWNGLAPLEEALAGVRRAVRWRRSALVLAGFAVGFAIGALLLLPQYDYARVSIRGQDGADGGGVGLAYATGWSLAPAEVPTFVLPAVAGFGKATYLGAMPFTDYPNYLGFLLLALAAAGWWRGDRGLTLALAVMAAVAVLVSFGGFGFGLYELLYRVLPFFDKFRIPSMVLILVGFAAIVLGVRGVAAWRDGAVLPRWPRALPVALGGLGGFLLLAALTGLAQGGHASYLQGLAAQAGRPAADVLVDEAWRLHRASLIRIGLILLVAASALWLSLRNDGFRRGGLAWVLGGLLALDLASVDRLVVHPEAGLLTVGRDAAGEPRLVPAPRLLRRPAPPQTTETATPAERALREAVGHDRVWPLGALGASNDLMALGIRSLGGYHAAKLADYERVRRRLFDQEPDARLANWLAATHVVYEGRFGAAEFAYFEARGLDLARRDDGGPGLHFYRNRAAAPRVRWATAWRPVAAAPGGGELPPFLDALAAGWTPATPVTLDAAPDPAPAAAAADLPPPTYVHDGMNEVVLATAAPVPAVLVLADMNAPGWRVEIDGEAAALLTADHLLRAVAVPAGEHEVRFHYRDASVRRGLLLAVAGLVVAVVLILTPNLRRVAARNRDAEA